MTLRRPEATAVVLGVARRLWRGRSLVYRGPQLIHAAADRPGPRDRGKYPGLDPDALPYGATLGVVDVVGWFAHAVWIQVRSLGRDGLIRLGLARKEE